MKTTSKRLLVALLTLVMAFSLAIPAMAATITIKPNNYTTTGDAVTERFEAYQIFAGELKDGNVPEDGTDGGMLVNITWGNSVKDVSGLLNALVDSTVTLADLHTEEYGAAITLGEAFKTALEAIGYETLPIEVGNSTQELQKTASAVAQVLSDLTGNGNNAALADAIARILAEKDGDEYKYLKDPKTSKWDAKADNNKGAWTIDTADYEGEGEDREVKDQNNGYYLIVDTYEETDVDKASSAYLVGVFGTSTIQVKTGTPKVDKEIVGSTNPDGADYNIGDTITFKLTATLPENYGNYDEFYLQFVDTLSEGLTYTNNVKVTVKVGEDTYVIEAGTNGYALDGPNEDGELTITFDDLKTLKGKKVTEGVPAEEAVSITLDRFSKVFVEYTAELNEKSLKPTGNPNEVQLEFSNDPKDSSKHGTTPKDTVYVYDFGINVIKYDGSDDKKLGGAGFAVTKKDGNVTYYALLTENEGDYYIAGWITEDDLKDAAKTEDLKGVEKVTVEGTEYYIAAKTAEGTGALNILGLDGGAYELVELIVPDGYDAIANIPVEFKATYFIESDLYDENGDRKTNTGYANDVKPGMLKGLTIEFTVNGQDFEVLVANDGYWLNDKGVNVNSTANEPDEGAVASSDLFAHLNVPNFPEGWLPGTGGMGTTLFYLIGGLLLAGAAVYLVLSSVKKGKAR